MKKMAKWLCASVLFFLSTAMLNAEEIRINDDVESSDQKFPAIDRMIGAATDMGANAIVAVRFSTSEIMSAAAVILIYGTAVVVEDIEE